jgi:hypothetical protein
MIRLIIIFSVMFAIGALVAVVVRTGAHHPYANMEEAHAQSAMPAISAEVTAPMAHSDHAVAAVVQTAAVNTICAICGMPVNPALGTALYHEKRIGFGCKTCPGQFAANPEKYGPSALKNVMAE